MTINIPFNKRYRSEREIDYISDALKREEIGGDGYYTKLVESVIKEKFGCGKVLLTTSATHALEMSMMLLDIKQGDEVIMPSFTFPSSANAAILRGAKPIFADIQSNTMNIDPDDIKRKITNRTKAIVTVDYAGVGCKMDEILDIANKYSLTVVEDAAQAVNAKYKGKYLGSWGHISCYSFHSTKNITAGEGGALIINSNDQKIMERAEIIRQKGTNRSMFIRGEIEKYSWVDIGSSYSPSDILMSLLYSQLIDADIITEKRKLIHIFFCDELEEYVRNGTITIMDIPPDCDPNYHLFYILLKDEATRYKLLRRLNNKGIAAAFHFVPLHSSPMGRKLGYLSSDLPITERNAACLLRLPIYTDMSIIERQYVADNLKEILGEL